MPITLQVEREIGALRSRRNEVPPRQVPLAPILLVARHAKERADVGYMLRKMGEWEVIERIAVSSIPGKDRRPSILSRPALAPVEQRLSHDALSRPVSEAANHAGLSFRVPPRVRWRRRDTDVHKASDVAALCLRHHHPLVAQRPARARQSGKTAEASRQHGVAVRHRLDQLIIAAGHTGRHAWFERDDSHLTGLKRAAS